MTSHIYGFGSFQLHIAERQLTCRTSVIRLQAKVFDTLIVLIVDAGRLLRKDALMRAIWPNHVVEENNLQHNICVLRRALARHDRRTFIETVPGQGYRFAGDVKIIERATLTEASATRSRESWLRLRPAPGWVAPPLNAIEELAVLSRRLDELRRSFGELSRELAEVEQHLQQAETVPAERVRENLGPP